MSANTPLRATVSLAFATAIVTEPMAAATVGAAFGAPNTVTVTLNAAGGAWCPSASVAVTVTVVRPNFSPRTDNE